MRSNATVPSGATSGSVSTTPMSAMFIGAVEVSAQSAHRAGTGTRSVESAALDSVYDTVDVSCSRRALTVRRSCSQVRCIHRPKAGVSRRTIREGAAACR
jgi:hypothetical protein